MNIFAKAAQGLNLSPAERAFLKLIKGWFYTALGTGIIAGSQYVMGTQVIDWQKLVYIVGTGVLLSILTALDKFFTAQGDTPLALATEAIEQKVQQLPVPQAAQQPSIQAQLAALPAPAQRAPEPIVLQPRPQSVAPASQGWTTNANPQMPVPQIAFPSPNATGNTPATDTISFGDTGIVPTVKA